jgi:hypothetical protein
LIADEIGVLQRRQSALLDEIRHNRL